MILNSLVFQIKYLYAGSKKGYSNFMLSLIIVLLVIVLGIAFIVIVNRSNANNTDSVFSLFKDMGFGND